MCECLCPSMNGHSWIDVIARRVIERSAGLAPPALAERLREEWMADMPDRRGAMSRLKFALGCYRAVFQIKRDCCPVSAPGSASPAGGRILVADAPYAMSPFPRRTTPSPEAPTICEINTAPLIDVLLVLLVTLIITLPMTTQAVKLTLPQSPAREQAPPEVINLDIDFDGTVAWNGSPVVNLAQLEGYFRAESRKYPQPEIHLRPDPHVKYGVVAKVLAAAQRNRLTKVGFVNSDAFAN